MLPRTRYIFNIKYTEIKTMANHTKKNYLFQAPNTFVNITMYKNPEIYFRVTMSNPLICDSANKYKIISKYAV